MAKMVAESEGRDAPRDPVALPYIPLAVLRKRLGLTLEAVCDRIGDATGERLGRGTLSAIEKGLRGASTETLHGLALAYGIDPLVIDTAYVPRHRAGHPNGVPIKT